MPWPLFGEPVFKNVPNTQPSIIERHTLLSTNEMLTPLQPKFITFDMLGTLTKLEWQPTARRLVAEDLSTEDAKMFGADFSVFRDAGDSWRIQALSPGSS